jgi:hypothetical protein
METNEFQIMKCLSARCDVCTFITEAVLSASTPRYYRIQQHYSDNHKAAKLLYLTCRAKLIFKIKPLIRVVSNGEFLTHLVAFLF